MMMDQAMSMPRDHHQAKISWRTMRSLVRLNEPDSVRCREKERTTRMPPNDSVAWASMPWRVWRMSRHRGADSADPGAVGEPNGGQEQQRAEQGGANRPMRG